MARDARDRNVDGFGRWADSYDRSLLQRLLFAPVHHCMLGQTAMMCPAPSSVLDIGCGTGLLLRKAAERFPSAQLTGIDAAEDMVRVAQALVPEGAPIHFAQAFAEQVPFPDASFDLVVTSMSFHHWADQQKALSEARRLLSPGGVFVLADLLATGPAGVFLAGSRWDTSRAPPHWTSCCVAPGSMWSVSYASPRSPVAYKWRLPDEPTHSLTLPSRPQTGFRARRCVGA